MLRLAVLTHTATKSACFLSHKTKFFESDGQKAVQRTRDKWNGPSRYSVLCSDHFTEDCFETDHLLASSFGIAFGIARRARLKPDVVPTHFVRANLRTGASGSSAMSLERTRKRTSTGGESELTSKREHMRRDKELGYVAIV